MFLLLNAALVNEVVEPPLDRPPRRVLELTTKIGDIVTLTSIHRIKNLLRRRLVWTSGHVVTHPVQTVKCIAPHGSDGVRQCSATTTRTNVASAGNGYQTHTGWTCAMAASVDTDNRGCSAPSFFEGCEAIVDNMEQDTEHVLEIEVSSDGDHSSHENTRTVFIVGDLNDLQNELVRAARLADMHWPGFLGHDGSALFCGSCSPDDPEWRQFIDETQDDVLIGDEVPV